MACRRLNNKSKSDNNNNNNNNNNNSNNSNKNNSANNNNKNNDNNSEFMVQPNTMTLFFSINVPQDWIKVYRCSRHTSNDRFMNYWTHWNAKMSKAFFLRT